MALNSGLFPGQNQGEQDLLQAPGWTIDEQRPGFFDNAALALPRGLGEAGANVVGTLAHGFQDVENSMSLDLLAAPQAKPAPSPLLTEIESKSREFAKSLTPDPRVTGAGANLVQGFSKAVAEFGAGTLAGGPLLGAGLLGVTEGNARYHDLLDQGVDEQTARRGGIVEGIAAGGGALLPMGLPAKWLGSSLSTAGTLLAQAGAGAAINTGFGIASRYAGARILADAGYPELAAQQQPFDEMNLAADAISGLFFGAHHGWGEINQSHVDPSVRDAAKVVQDRQAAAERAPGIPVDMRAAAVHRQALETSIADLLAGKSVDVSAADVDGATYARAGEDPLTPEARELIADHFKQAGVLKAAEAHDFWLRGDELDQSPEAPLEAPPKPQDAAAGQGEDAAGEGAAAEETPEPGPLADRPNLQIVDEDGTARSAAAEQTRAAEESSRVNGEADTMFQAAVNCEARRGAV